MNYEKNVVLIPGASRPLGRAIARTFAQQETILVLPTYTDWPESTDEMQEEFTAKGFDFLCVDCDLTKSDNVASLMSKISSTYGKLNYLINNIERGGMPVVHGSYNLDINRDQWQLELETTLKAKWNLFTKALPLLQKAETASVTNISSIAGTIGRSGPASYLFNDGYSAANRAVQTLTQTWARDGAPRIRVNEVMLGLIQGRHAQHTRGWELLDHQQQKNLLQHTLLKRSGTPEEVAKTVYFLTVEASYITGTVVTVDGGYCLGADKAIPLPPGVL